MELQLWKNFSKRSNSTKQPGTADTVLQVSLKEDTSIEAPSFIVSGHEFGYNYAYAFGHYYFISDIISLANGYTQINCAQDLLATYKSDILNTSAYVKYSTSNYDAMINDPRTIQRCVKSTSSASVSTGLSTTGCYVLTCANYNPGATGFGASYIMTQSDVTAVAKFLMRDIEDEENALEWLQKIFEKPFDSLISIKWLPIDYSTVVSGCTSGSKTIVVLGKTGVTYVDDSGTSRNLQAYKISNTTPISIGAAISSVPFHYSDYRRAEPYTTLEVFLPFYGLFAMNPMEIIGSLQMDMKVDPLTGDTTVLFKSLDGSGGSRDITTINYNIGVDCPLSQIQNSGNGVIASIGGVASSALGVATGGMSIAAAGVTALASAVSASIDLASITTSVKGSISGRSWLGFGFDLKVIITYIDTIDPDNMLDTIGRPVMQVETLSSLSGYVECSNASVQMAGFENDKNAINALLDSGIFIE